MKLVPWKKKDQIEVRPRSPMAEMDREFSRFFDHMSRGRMEDLWPFGHRGDGNDLAPVPLDVSETDNEVVVKADMPGIDPSHVAIEVTQDRMTIRAERKQETHEKDRNYVHIERRYGGFSRTVPLPSHVDADKASAAYKDGVLEIRLPRREGVKPKRIEVKT